VSPASREQRQGGLIGTPSSGHQSEKSFWGFVALDPPSNSSKGLELNRRQVRDPNKEIFGDLGIYFEFQIWFYKFPIIGFD
jgi:hypothetical protein